MQLARRTDDRYRDLSEKARNKARQWLDRSSAAGHLVRLVEHREQLDDDEQKQVFGESLPKGLRLSTGLA